MTVPASRRGKSRMEVFAKANELCSYTVEITANERTFKPEFAMLTARIVDASVAIGQYLWSANNIKVVDDDDLVAVLKELDHRVAADEAGAAGDEHAGVLGVFCFAHGFPFGSCAKVPRGE